MCGLKVTRSVTSMKTRIIMMVIQKTFCGTRPWLDHLSQKNLWMQAVLSRVSQRLFVGRGVRWIWKVIEGDLNHIIREAQSSLWESIFKMYIEWSRCYKQVIYLSNFITYSTRRLPAKSKQISALDLSRAHKVLKGMKWVAVMKKLSLATVLTHAWRSSEVRSFGGTDGPLLTPHPDSTYCWPPYRWATVDPPLLTPQCSWICTQTPNAKATSVSRDIKVSLDHVVNSYDLVAKTMATPTAIFKASSKVSLSLHIFHLFISSRIADVISGTLGA